MVYVGLILSLTVLLSRSYLFPSVCNTGPYFIICGNSCNPKIKYVLKEIIPGTVEYYKYKSL